jgi:Putative DNA-binding domain/Protein of unknown function (DUF2934)
MLARLIETWNALPRASGSHLQERLWFDLKETYAPGKRAEMAKDVAAFANAEGGVLIIGAKEGPTEPDYSSALASAYAAKLEGEFDLAVRDFCRPSPAVHVRTIPVPGAFDKVILVVNVEPIVDQPVAARHEDDKDMWRFPIRVGRHTEYILPEQLPLYMNSKARRAKLLLLRAVEAGGEIELFTVPAGGMKHSNIQGAVPFKIEAVDAEGGGALVIRETEHEGQAATIPIDDVEAVWREHSGKWAVRVSGRLEHFTNVDGSDPNRLTYTPPSTFVVSPVGRVVSDLVDRVKEISKALNRTLVVEQHPRVEPPREEIAKRAYQLWQVRERHDAAGTPESDWLRARAQLLTALRSE